MIIFNEVGTLYQNDIMDQPDLNLAVYESGLELVIKKALPFEYDISTFYSENILCGLFENCNIIYFSVKFGNSQWERTSYSIHMSHSFSKFPINEKEECVMSIFLVDSSTNITEAIRTVKLPIMLSKSLRSMINKQKFKTINKYEYDKLVDACYKKLSPRSLSGRSSLFSLINQNNNSTWWKCDKCLEIYVPLNNGRCSKCIEQYNKIEIQKPLEYKILAFIKLATSLSSNNINEVRKKAIELLDYENEVIITNLEKHFNKQHSYIFEKVLDEIDKNKMASKIRRHQ